MKKLQYKQNLIENIIHALGQFEYQRVNPIIDALKTQAEIIDGEKEDDSVSGSE